MTNEDAIKWLDNLKNDIGNPHYECLWPYAQAIDEICKMLEEQKAIVRCEDCKHRPTYPEAYGAEINGRWCYWCELLRVWKPDDWFCANGKRR